MAATHAVRISHTSFHGRVQHIELGFHLPIVVMLVVAKTWDGWMDTEKNAGIMRNIIIFILSQSDDSHHLYENCWL